MFRKSPETKSDTLSRELVVNSEGKDAEELAASIGVVGAAVVIGVVEANRTAAAFRIKVFDFENREMLYIRDVEGPFAERNGLGPNCPCCTFEEEN
jgi:hypothetical protein